MAWHHPESSRIMMIVPAFRLILWPLDYLIGAKRLLIPPTTLEIHSQSQSLNTALLSPTLLSHNPPSSSPPPPPQPEQQTPEVTMECFRQIARLVKSPFRREKQQKVLEIVSSTAYAPMMFILLLMRSAFRDPQPTFVKRNCPRSSQMTSQSPHILTILLPI